MLIWQTRATDEPTIRDIAAHAVSGVECLRRVDGSGGLVLCEDGEVPQGVVEMRAMPILASGDTRPEAGSWVFLVVIRAPPAWRDELCDWYSTEHGPILLECAQWRGFTLFDTGAEGAWCLCVLHRLAHRAALESEERKRSRATPWFQRLARNAWFDGPFERVLAQRIDLRD